MPVMTADELERKALRIQAVVEEQTLQEHGMVPMFVRPTDYQLPTAADYRGMAPHRALKGKTEAELGLPPMHVWRAWENTSANTGYYLGAMSYRYRCTSDPDVLAICRPHVGRPETHLRYGRRVRRAGVLDQAVWWCRHHAVLRRSAPVRDRGLGCLPPYRGAGGTPAPLTRCSPASPTMRFVKGIGRSRAGTSRTRSIRAAGIGPRATGSTG